MRTDALEYLVKRMALVPVLILAISLIVFFLGRAVPGDPALLMAHPGASEQAIANLKAKFGLDKPIWVQYGEYMWGFFQGDLGVSFRYPDREVSELLFPAMWVSLQLNLAAMFIWLPAGILIGIVAAQKHKTKIDPILINSTLLPRAIPSMILIQMFIVIALASKGVLPVSGFEGMFSKHIIIPALTLALPAISGMARLMRASTLGVLNQPFVILARAKGLSSRTIALKHIFPNAFAPVFTQLMMSFALLLTGTFFVELIYGIPGAGRLIVDSILGSRDYNVIMGFTLIVAIVFILMSLVADVLYTIFDPRVKPGETH